MSSGLLASLFAVGASTDRSLLPVVSQSAQLRVNDSPTSGGKRPNRLQTNLEDIAPTHYAIFWAYDGFKGETPVRIFPAPPEPAPKTVTEPAPKPSVSPAEKAADEKTANEKAAARKASAEEAAAEKVAAEKDATEKAAAEKAEAEKLRCPNGYVAANTPATDVWCADNCKDGCSPDAQEVCMCDDGRSQQEREHERKQQQQQQQQQQQKQQQQQQQQKQKQKQQQQRINTTMLVL